LAPNQQQGYDEAMKEAISVIASLLVLVSYVPYIRDMLRHKTKPHVYSWFIWGTTSAVVFFLQLSAGAGPGAFVTLSAVILTFIIFGLGLKQGDKDITRSDTAFFLLALVAAGFWLVADQPLISIILLTLTEVLGFAPTIRKSWHKPHEETLFSWTLNGFRFMLAIFALGEINVVTALYPVVWAVGNLGLAALLVVRRRQLAAAHE
jgi:hypothetical protein